MSYHSIGDTLTIFFKVVHTEKHNVNTEVVRTYFSLFILLIDGTYHPSLPTVGSACSPVRSDHRSCVHPSSCRPHQSRQWIKCREHVYEPWRTYLSPITHSLHAQWLKVKQNVSKRSVCICTYHHNLYWQTTKMSHVFKQTLFY